MKVALVHEWITPVAGSEKILEASAELYPQAPIYCVIYQGTDAEAQRRFPGHPIHSSFIRHLPFSRTKYRAYLPLMPLAIEQFDLGGYDVILSTSHAVAKGVLTRPDQLHISTICTPIRYAWDLQEHYLKESGLTWGIRSMIVRSILHYMRLWDVASAQRVDKFIAISRYIARRVEKTYRRPCTVIYPPVDVERFEPQANRANFFLAMSRFVPYKKMDLIVEAFSQLRLPLKVIGDGPDWKKVKRLAAPNVELLGKCSDSDVKRLMEQCRAFIFAADEDFGIVVVEAQAAGAPVIAFGRGGAVETVVDGETGYFFHQQTVESLMNTVNKFEAVSGVFDVHRIRQNAERFSRRRFMNEFREFVNQSWDAFQNSGSPSSSLPISTTSSM